MSRLKIWLLSLVQELIVPPILVVLFMTIFGILENALIGHIDWTEILSISGLAGLSLSSLIILFFSSLMAPVMAAKYSIAIAIIVASLRIKSTKWATASDIILWTTAGIIASRHEFKDVPIYSMLVGLLVGLVSAWVREVVIFGWIIKARSFAPQGLDKSA